MWYVLLNTSLCYLTLIYKLLTFTKRDCIISLVERNASLNFKGVNTMWLKAKILNWLLSDHTIEEKVRLKYKSVEIVEKVVDSKDDIDCNTSPNKTKVCKKCNKRRSSRFFFTSNKNKDGLTKWCVTCLKSDNKN